MQRIRVLIVDDDEDDYFLTTELLAEIDAKRYVMDWASTYADARTQIYTASHDLYLVDYRLGSENGLALIREAASMVSAPMILLTGHGDHDIDVMAMEAGAADYLVKGEVNAQVLERSIRYSLERTHTLAALRQAKAEADRASQIKSLFLANMSHEIRTPLTAVIGVSELMLTTPLSETQLDYATTIHNSSRILLDLINDILDFSKIETGNLQLESVPVVLADLFTTLQHLFQATANAKSIELTFQIDADVPAAILGDPIRLRQVLVNLVNNALKFTHQGRVALHVAAQRQVDHTDWLRFCVTDTGIGIPPAQRDRLFKAFSQVDASTTRRFGGTGLGLAICQRLVTLFGGTIEAESEPDKGSRFSFSIPCQAISVRAQPDTRTFVLPAGKTASLLDTTFAGRFPLRILLAEDNVVNQKVVVRILAGLGYAADVVSDGKLVLQRLNERAYDLILMDVQMPNMDGIETTRHIVSDPLHAPPPRIVALTASATADDQKRCADAGMTGYLTKPINVGDLRHILQEVHCERQMVG